MTIEFTPDFDINEKEEKPVSKTLNMLSQELILTEQHIAENNGELDFQSEAELEQIKNHLVEKTDSYAYRIEKLTLAAGLWDQKAKDAKEIRDRIQKHIEAMKERIHVCMVQMGKRELSGEESRFSIRTASQPMVVIDDAADLPSHYKKQTITITPDKKKISDAVKKGEDIPGVKLEYTEYVQLGKAKVL